VTLTANINPFSGVFQMHELTNAHHLAAMIMIGFAIGMVVLYAIIIIPFWFICKKAGFSPWLSLLNLVPLGGLILMYVLAFADWNVVPVPQAPWQPLQPSTPQPPQLPPQA
jgi:hypothetical protein